jgi:hypothetical protein
VIDRRDLLAWVMSLLGDRWGAAPGEPRGLPAQRIVMLDRAARAQFHYQQPVPNQAAEHYAAVEAHRPWTGNCVTLAMTTLSLLQRAGSPPGTLFVLLVLDAQHHGQHAVGLARDDYGRRWVVGDTFGQAYPYAFMRHKLEREYRFS